MNVDASADSTRLPLTRMRRAIARSMSASALVPQFTIESDAKITELSKARKALASEGTEVSYTDFFIAACAASLVEHPMVNSSFLEDSILVYSVRNIGVAVALEDGLIAPAILGADGLSLADIVRERKRLTAAATAGTLTPEELLSTTFTVSNLGPYGVRRFRALVVPPQAAILAVGALTPEELVSFSLSCDHRVLDGAPAALFLNDLIVRLEHPDWVRDLA
jgi:pyruvate dehydrogenase E2 component (dihydrolipoamide acetyltransferase)